jgi:alpha-beta hydrolase superfamily lysophospholipase
MSKSSPLQTWPLRLIKIVIVLFLVLNLVLASHAWKFTHFYNDPVLRKPQETGFFSTVGFIIAGNRIPKRLNDSLPSAAFQAFNVTTSDDLKIGGWYLKPKDRLANKPAVIMLHGHGSCSSAILPEANWFLNAGYPVYMFDFRAHGNSDGEQSLVGMKETADLKAVYDYVVSRGEKKIILFGVSMGAATILKAINDYPVRPYKLILEMPFATLADATRGKLRIMNLPEAIAPPLVFWGGVLNGKWAFSYTPYLYTGKIHCPVLLQWGRYDPRVTGNETMEIFSHIPTSRKLVVYENSAHESLYLKEPAKWVENVSAFLAN